MTNHAIRCFHQNIIFWSVSDQLPDSSLAEALTVLLCRENACMWLQEKTLRGL